MTKHLLFLSAFSLLVSACGGGGGGSSTPTAPAQSQSPTPVSETPTPVTPNPEPEAPTPTPEPVVEEVKLVDSKVDLSQFKQAPNPHFAGNDQAANEFFEGVYEPQRIKISGSNVDCSPESKLVCYGFSRIIRAADGNVIQDAWAYQPVKKEWSRVFSKSFEINTLKTKEMEFLSLYDSLNDNLSFKGDNGLTPIAFANIDLFTFPVINSEGKLVAKRDSLTFSPLVRSLNIAGKTNSIDSSASVVYPANSKAYDIYYRLNDDFTISDSSIIGTNDSYSSLNEFAKVHVDKPFCLHDIGAVLNFDKSLTKINVKSNAALGCTLEGEFVQEYIKDEGSLTVYPKTEDGKRVIYFTGHSDIRFTNLTNQVNLSKLYLDDKGKPVIETTVFAGSQTDVLTGLNTMINKTAMIALMKATTSDSEASELPAIAAEQ